MVTTTPLGGLDVNSQRPVKPGPCVEGEGQTCRSECGKGSRGNKWWPEGTVRGVSAQQTVPVTSQEYPPNSWLGLTTEGEAKGVTPGTGWWGRAERKAPHSRNRTGWS